MFGCPLLFRPNLAMAHPRHIVHPLFVSPLAKGEIKWGCAFAGKTHTSDATTYLNSPTPSCKNGHQRISRASAPVVSSNQRSRAVGSRTEFLPCRSGCAV